MCPFSFWLHPLTGGGASAPARGLTLLWWLHFIIPPAKATQRPGFVLQQ
ncbi:protein toll [Acetobacter orientalis]|uniref:Protein toll n=1 Tax=Acetobacter orientalis TaxID=146474 RepID=A0A2Z5ZM26_9PROT|nr:protein toll [Acetobacter orientalis]